MTPARGLVNALTLLLLRNSVPSLVEMEDPGVSGDEGGGVGEAGSERTEPGEAGLGEAVQSLQMENWHTEHGNPGAK